jgi:rhodanese-related sulfurtransferase
MQPIANSLALEMTAANLAVLIDVREPAEFWEGHLPGAINLPSTQFNLVDYRAFGQQPILLICNSGSRVKQIASKLDPITFPHVFMLEAQMDDLNEAQAFGNDSNELVALNAGPITGWTVDRQFRMTLGLLLLTFLLGYFLWSPLFLIIPTILCAGLIYTALIDRSYLRQGIAMLPWNRVKKQETGNRNQGLNKSSLTPNP